MNRLVLLFELLACSFSLLVLSGCPPAPQGPPDCTVTHCTIPDGGYALWACDDERDTLYVDLSAFEVGPSLNPGYEELECDADVVEYLGSFVTEGYAVGDGCATMGIPADRIGSSEEVCGAGNLRSE